MAGNQINLKIDIRKAKAQLKKMQAQLGERYYHQDEVTKLIKAFQDKYNDAGCDGLPYNPKGIIITLQGKKV